MVLQLEMSKNTAHVTKLLQLQLYKMAVVRKDCKTGMLV
jgi:hypothetical protein